jgi:hypothetical protein
VREGAGIAAALEKTGQFPPMMIHLIASGEASGKLEEMLERAAINQEREIETMIATVLGLFEPMLILVMGGVVAPTTIDAPVGADRVRDGFLVTARGQFNITAQGGNSFDAGFNTAVGVKFQPAIPRSCGINSKLLAPGQKLDAGGW